MPVIAYLMKILKTKQRKTKVHFKGPDKKGQINYSIERTDRRTDGPIDQQDLGKSLHGLHLLGPAKTLVQSPLHPTSTKINPSEPK